MKKVDSSHYWRQQRIMKDRFQRKFRKKKQRVDRVGKNLLGRLTAAWGNRDHIQAPTAFNFHPENLDAARAVTLELERCAARGKKALLDFDDTEHISAMAMVYLYSEIHRIIDAGACADLIRISDKRAPRHIRLALQECGLLKLTQSGRDPNGQMTPIVCGQGDNHLEEIVDQIMTKALQDKQLDEARKAEAELITSRALQEAMLNVLHHAHREATSHRWWATAMIIERQLFIAICDRGVGIPKTLPTSSFWRYLAHAVTRASDDHELIKQAMIYTRSSTHSPRKGKGNRGLGSKDMQNLVLTMRSGYMTIVSGRGYYKLEGETAQEHSHLAKHDFEGTIVQWCLPLDSDLKRSA